ncbi:HelD family protein [Streptomyces cinereoruber]|uniref:AAA family ATPase n=1 Tax=Streptomyces cinereoruber TaxID=67260 RepID=A0ABX6BS10_9ACTN|nr:UvrD-helicase domain-containing protein [Streptomyces cinereoruber]MBB4156803.1 DNA helicase IV [Streptomyces cinereoruber]MBY8815370.1 AAA family ATPase [Streptomyces cinereoruber]NIH60099.1 DNA helicase IV [Streptomyces cinereoruber]QEV36922.1 AAA family ATPase [Streptomyces cinereoruber]
MSVPEVDQPPSADDPLARERAHLAASRAALRAMREDVQALDIKDVTANWVNAVVLERQIEDRIKALADLAGTPLFFGRLDYLHTTQEGQRFYIGRRHVHDADGDPMVIDWRAPVSQPFYRASRKDPQDVGLRRRFGYTGGELTAYEDEHLSDPEELERTSRLLQAEIERPRVGPMRDIVATIQPEQDEIVRSDLSGSVCVQGGPGTGKTAVGLHRVAYLLYAHRERLARTGTLVVGPNRSFLQYIEQVLPALGELEVKQATVDDLVAHVEVRGTDAAATAVVKGDARMAEVLRRAVRSHVRLPEESLMVVRGSRRWRVPAYEIEEMVRELLDRDIRYGAAREALPQRIAHAVLVRMEQAGEAPDDRVQNAVARNAAVKAVVKECWPPVDPAKLVLRLLSDAGFLAEHAEGVLTEDEQKLLLWDKPARSVKTAKWSAADAVLVDEAKDLVERTHSLGHVVLDEAQDLSPMQYRAVGRRCTTGSATVLGDLAQGTTPWATGSWAQALGHLGKPEAVVEELTAGFRVPREVIAYASRLLPHMSPGLAPVESVRENPGSLAVRSSRAEDLDADVVAACVEALGHEGSIGLIAADARIAPLAEALAAAGLTYLSPGEETTAESRLTLVPASLAKGLEYDYVVLDEPAAVVDGEPDERTGLRRLYVALTRAVSGLTVVHSAPVPEQLGAV